MNTKIIVVAIVGALVIGGSSFYAGTKLSSNNDRPNIAQMDQGGQMRGGPNATGGMQGRPNMMGGGVSGEIVAKDDANITIKLSSIASSTDLMIGEDVMVVGTPTSEGFPAR